MAFVLESGCKGIAFFDTMQDFCKEKCNIYLVFNNCLHIESPFVGAHIVFITRERVGEGTNDNWKISEHIYQIESRFWWDTENDWNVFGIFWGNLGRLCGVGSPPTALLAWVKKRTQINSPTPIPSPLERGVNTPASCWRTGHGDPALLWFASPITEFFTLRYSLFT